MIPGRLIWVAAVAIAIVAAAATAALMGGGDDDSADAPEKPPAPRDTTVSFDGGSLPGTVYFNAGQDGLNADLYRSRGSLDGVERITRDGRVSIISAYDGKLAVSNAKGAGSDRLELANLSARDVLPGTLVDSAGQSPSFSPSGRLLYTKPRYTDDGGDAGLRFYSTDSDGRGKRSVWSTDDPGVNADWGPGERIAAVYDEKPPIVIDPGGRRERTVRVPLDKVVAFRTSARGSIVAGDGEGHLAVVPPRGPARTFETGWGPLAWSPDGGSLLVSRGERLGLMSAADGSVKAIGQVRNGEVFGAAWVGTGN